MPELLAIAIDGPKGVGKTATGTQRVAEIATNKPYCVDWISRVF